MVQFIGVARVNEFDYEVVSANSINDVTDLIKYGIRDLELVQVEPMSEADAVEHISAMDQFQDPIGKYAIQIRQNELAGC